MKCKLICCEVFTREASMYVATSPHTIDPEFTPKGAHENPQTLQQCIQQKIQETEGKGYDYILLGYGLCGNSINGLIAGSVPLVIPRAHDCCTIFLGSRSRFVEYFGDQLSTEWSSAGYMERGESYLRGTDTGKLLGMDKNYDQYIEEYGEENAKYIWEMLHPHNDAQEMIYIDTPGTSHLGFLDKIRKIAEEQSKEVRVLQGDMRLLEGLVYGTWNEDEYLMVQPGERICAVYDQHVIITAEPRNAKNL